MIERIVRKGRLRDITEIKDNRNKRALDRQKDPADAEALDEDQ